MKKLFLILFMIPMKAHAAGIQATVSATVMESVTLSQADDGSIEASGTPPLYCTTSPTETMCYY